METETSRAYDESTQRVMNDRVLKKYGNYMQEYSQGVIRLQKKFSHHTWETWDPFIDAISVNFNPMEMSSFEEIIECSDKNLQKCLVLFSCLSQEVLNVAKEANEKFFPGLIFYGEGDDCKDSTDGDSQLCIGRMTSFFNELLMFVEHCSELVQNLMKQICAVYCSNPKERVFDLTDLHLGSVFDILSIALRILMTFDVIIAQNQLLVGSWKQYEKMIKSVGSDPSCIGVSQDKIVQLEEVLSQIDLKLFSMNIFKNIVDTCIKMCGELKSNILYEEFVHYVRIRITDIDAKLADGWHCQVHDLTMRACCLFVLCHQLFSESDKKLFKQLWEMCKKLPAIPLYGNIMFYPDKFLNTYLPKVVSLVERKPLHTMANLRLDYLNKKSNNLSRDVQQYSSLVQSWLLSVESLKSQDDAQIKLDDMNKECKLLLQGLNYAGYLQAQVQSLLNMYVSLSKPMSKTTVVSVCALLELLKVIFCSYHTYGGIISPQVTDVIQHLTYVLLTKLQTLQKKVEADKKFPEKNAQTLQCLKLLTQLISGPPTVQRMYITEHLLCFSQQSKLIKDDLAPIIKNLELLWSVAHLNEELRVRCDCSFLYWHRIIFPIYIKHVYSHPGEVYRLQYVFEAASDCLSPMDHVYHLPSTNSLKEEFKETLFVYLKEQLLDPLCKDVETELRLNVHSHLKPLDRNPFQIQSKEKYPALTRSSIRLFDKLISIKGYVENYLDRTYYNLTTVALHDWKSYQEMANLAQFQYQLHTVKSNLPSQTLEQGLDVLEIMRNIHVFVSQYFYNLNAQVFIEKTSNSKHLNTISIKHIANSMRTHGTGIRNTTVNFTYQFLRKKFFVFSQFLYDDHIKSKLLKDLRYFKQTRDHLDPRFPYERAQKFNKDIRKLGVTKDGLTFLDQFRILITEIGNALGYVRMVRSGSLHSCSNAITFIPDLNDVVKFEDLCKQENLSEECQQAASQLDLVISDLTNHFTHETEYFRLLVDVFATVINSSKNSHLKNFFVIVPALTINFIEHIVNTKERMNKKNKENASFTDDGFAMGVAYILKLLNVNEEFDSLNWFKSVQEKYRLERDKILEEKQKPSTPRTDEKLSQTHFLTIKRLDTYLKEFELLNYCFSSARIFFYFGAVNKDNPGTILNVPNVIDPYVSCRSSPDLQKD